MWRTSLNITNQTRFPRCIQLGPNLRYDKHFYFYYYFFRMKKKNNRTNDKRTFHFSQKIKLKMTVHKVSKKKL